MWSKDQYDLLTLILNEVIPPNAEGTIPGAGTLGVADFLPSATAYATDPIGDISAVLAFVAGAAPSFANSERAVKVETLKATEAALPAAFATLIKLTYMGYYSRPEARPLTGVGAQPVHPHGYTVQPETDAELAELTGPVRARGTVFRQG